MAGLADCFSAIDFTGHQSVITAVSGGSDSTALLILAHEHLSIHAPAAKLFAVTVDHSLRPESTSEASQVAQLCKRIGVQHITKRWNGIKPSSGIQAAAREARYDLLSEAATELGAGLVLTGHTQDDQLETVQMRQQRGEGQGLAGIATATLAFRNEGPFSVWFTRPLLILSRAALRDDLSRRGIGWIDDPSNTNTEFERVRARQKLAALDERSIAALHDVQALWAHRRHDLSGRIGKLVTSHLTKAAPGLYCAAPDLWREDDNEAVAGALRVMMAFAGGLDRMIDREAALALVARLQKGESFRTTGSRALLDRRRQGLFVLREDRDMQAHGSWFDGRYVVRPGAPSTIAPLSDFDAPGSLIAQAQRLEPPSGHEIVRHILNPWPKRVPLFDLPAASALASLAGEPGFPPAPCSL
jgi:tRNA(Ile)-lysidine synthase